MTYHGLDGNETIEVGTNLPRSAVLLILNDPIGGIGGRRIAMDRETARRLATDILRWSYYVEDRPDMTVYHERTMDRGATLPDDDST